MPRLPTVEDMGQRPIPQAYRGSPITVPNAGAVSSAAGQLGEQIAGMGQHMIEKEDKLNYASARASLLKADVTARQELQDDPNYETFQARYNDKMSTAKEAASGMIKSHSDRALFGAESSVDIQRGLGEVGQLAHGKRIAADKGKYAQGLIDLNEAGQGALDDATREQTIHAMNDMVDGAVKGGIISPEEAVRDRRTAVQSYVSQQFNSRMARKDYAGAKAILDSSRKLIDGDLETRMDANLIDGMDHRDVLTAADNYFTGAVAVKPSGNLAAPVSNDKIFSALIQQESGGKAQYGPPTKWGRAEGSAQMLPSTAQGVAKKIGMAWHPELMGDNNSKEALAYQQSLGRAYFDEGLAKYHGDVRMALKYYHGGPDEKQHGPKTEQYANDILKRVGVVDQQSPGHYDLNQALDWADTYSAAQGWTPEKRDELKKEIQSRVSMDEHLKARQEDDLEQGLWEKVDALGDNLKNPSQLGEDYYKLPAEKRQRFKSIIDANLVPKEVKANGEIATRLELLRIKDPVAFSNLTLTQFSKDVTAAELQGLRKDQMELKVSPPSDMDLRAKVASTISTYDTPDLGFGDKANGAVRRVRVQRIMESELQAMTGGKRKPTDTEMYQAFTSATGQVAMTYNNTLFGIETGGKNTKNVRRFDLTIDDIPPNIADNIRKSAKANLGKDLTDEQVAEEYATYKGRYW